MTKYALLAAITLPFALSGCGASGDASDGSPQPGEYQQTVKVTELDFPGVDENSKKQMIDQMEQAAGGGTGGKFCMKGGEGAGKEGGQWKEAASQMSQMLGGNCETIKNDGSATTLDLEMSCKGTPKGDMTIVATGQANTEGYTSTMAFDIKDPASEETAKLAMEIGAKRVGDCPG